MFPRPGTISFTPVLHNRQPPLQAAAAAAAAPSSSAAAAASSPPRRIISLNPVTRTEQSALNVISSMWAQNTWSTRSRIWDHLIDFCKRNNLDPKQPQHLDYAIMLWTESTRSTTSVVTRLKYASDLAAVASRLGASVPVTRMYCAGLRASGGLIPLEQAPPINFEQLKKLRAAAASERNGDRLCAALFLAWKTASRWDEVSRITGASLIRLDNKEIIIEWLDRTKTTRSDPFRLDSFTTLIHEPQVPEAIMSTLRRLGRNEFLTNRTTSWLDTWMARVLPPNNNSSKVTAHSIKRGAMDFLALAVDHGHLDRIVLPVIAKHKVDWDIPSTTLRYISNKVAKAHMNRTAEATILLPW